MKQSILLVEDRSTHDAVCLCVLSANTLSTNEVSVATFLLPRFAVVLAGCEVVFEVYLVVIVDVTVGTVRTASLSRRVPVPPICAVAD